MATPANTVEPFDLGIVGHPGSPNMFHTGLGAVNGLGGQPVGASQGNIFALLTPPDLYRVNNNIKSSNTRTGRKQAAGRPTRGLTPVINKGQ